MSFGPVRAEADGLLIGPDRAVEVLPALESIAEVEVSFRQARVESRRLAKLDHRRVKLASFHQNPAQGVVDRGRLGLQLRRQIELVDSLCPVALLDFSKATLVMFVSRRFTPGSAMRWGVALDGSERKAVGG